jgi:DUF177 domain-containing protein
MRAPLRAWYTAADVEALAARRATLVGEIKLGDLARLSEYLRATRGWRDREQAGGSVVKVELAFGTRQLGLHTLGLRYEAVLDVICQRCLDVYSLAISNRVEFAILTSESSLAAELGERDEPLVLAKDERICPAELVEDELIISVPLAPKHTQLEQCAASSRIETGSNVGD